MTIGSSQKFVRLKNLQSVANDTQTLKFYLFFSLADQITIIGNEMCVLNIRFANVWFQIKQIYEYFAPT